MVPLSDEAWAIFEALPQWTGNDYHLFSYSGGERPVTGISHAKAKLMANVEKNYRTHDLRVTAETRLALLGFSQEVRDAVLGHAKLGLQRTYNKYGYLTEKRDAMAALGKHIHSIVQI